MIWKPVIYSEEESLVTNFDKPYNYYILSLTLVVPLYFCNDNIFFLEYPSIAHVDFIGLFRKTPIL